MVTVNQTMRHLFGTPEKVVVNDIISGMSALP